jgi:hypothetical protein
MSSVCQLESDARRYPGVFEVTVQAVDMVSSDAESSKLRELQASATTDNNAPGLVELGRCHSADARLRNSPIWPQDSCEAGPI